MWQITEAVAVCEGVHMVLEIAELTIRPGEEEAFAAAYERAARLVRDSPGCLSMRMTRGIESPSRFVLLVEWESLTHHTEGFRESSSFRAWREELGPFFAESPRVEHAVDLEGPR
ncbi:MAG: antibiotic biosynthesis monooxygenase family protein [Pseudonocardiaceae bacterium]